MKELLRMLRSLTLAAVMVVPPCVPASPPHPRRAARARSERPDERRELGCPTRRRIVRGREPRRPGEAVAAVLLGVAGADRGPREDAADRRADTPVAADRPFADLRVRRQHGRPGNAPPPRAPPAPARR